MIGSKSAKHGGESNKSTTRSNASIGSPGNELNNESSIENFELIRKVAITGRRQIESWKQNGTSSVGEIYILDESALARCRKWRQQSRAVLTGVWLKWPSRVTTHSRHDRITTFLHFTMTLIVWTGRAPRMISVGRYLAQWVSPNHFRHILFDPDIPDHGE